jgi:hypothetical protein
VAPANRRRLPIVAFSVAGHAGVLLAVLATQPAPQAAPELAPMTVALIDLQRPPPPPPPEPPKLPTPSTEPAPKTAPKPAPPKPPPPRRLALADAHRGRALKVWDGDWVRHGAQEGAGLAAVREAILWEVGFAPKACRAEAVQGLVLISLNDAPGSARIVVGSGSWRWSDLLRSRAAR